MPEDKQSLLDHYRTTRDALLAAIDGLTDAQFTDRTLDGWSVKDHLAHIATWDDVRASEVERISAGHATAWPLGEPADSYNPIAYELRKDLSVAQVRWELDTTRRKLLDAIAAATPRGLDQSLYGDAGLLSHHEELHTGWIRRWRAERSY
jgi:uncharacterized damage-inducible protein DinB